MATALEALGGGGMRTQALKAFQENTSLSKERKGEAPWTLLTNP